MARRTRRSAVSQSQSACKTIKSHHGDSQTSILPQPTTPPSINDVAATFDTLSVTSNTQDQTNDWTNLPKCTAWDDLPSVPKTSSFSEIATDAETICAEAKKANAGYPFTGLPTKLVLQAPLVINEVNARNGKPFKLAEQPQSNSLFTSKIPAEIKDHILVNLFTHHGSIWKFASTCQTAFDMIGWLINHFNSSEAYYGSCDKNPQAYKPCDRYESCHMATVPNNICSECHNKLWKFSDLVKTGPITVVSKYHEEKISRSTFPLQLDSVQRLTMAFNNYPESIKILHLHRTEFLTIHVLKLIIPSLWKLTSLGIYACPMIHIGHLQELLALCQDKTVVKGRRVILDIYPRFHYGPKLPPHSKHVSNDFGACYNTFVPPGWNYSCDIRIAVLTIIYKAIKQAKESGYDLVPKESALYLWLTNLGIGELDDTLQALKCQSSLRTIANAVDPRNRRAGLFLKSGTFTFDQTYTCRQCLYALPGIFWDPLEHWCTTQAPWTPRNPCLGCQLTQHIELEVDHFKGYINRIVRTWLEDVSDISEAVQPFQVARGKLQAGLLEELRVKWIEEREAKGRELFPQKSWWKNPKFVYSQTVQDRNWLGQW